jgi:hypothetical protein
VTKPIGRVLRAGVTSIAVPGGKWFTDVTVREAVEGGLLEGPRMVVAGRALSNYGGIFDPDPYPAFEGTPADTAGVLCNTRDEFIRETRKQCKRGVDLIKITDSTWGDVQTSPMTRSPLLSTRLTDTTSKSLSTRAVRPRPAPRLKPASI